MPDLDGGRMKVIANNIPVMTIEEFADTHGLEMEIHERRVPVDSHNRYYAHFRSADILQGGSLCGTYGDGATPEEAVATYAKAISLMRLVIDAYQPTRRELDVPRLREGAVCLT